MQDKTFLEVAVASPLMQTLTYAPPAYCPEELKPGLRLLVPLGKRLVTGYLLGPAPEPEADFKVRRVAELLDPAPIFPESMVAFYRWIARYYHHPIGEVIKTALPGGLITQSGRKIRLTADGRKHLAGSKEIKKQWFIDLLNKHILSQAACRKIWRTRDRKVIEKWAAGGLVEIIAAVSGDTIKPRTEICVFPVMEPAESNDSGLKKSECKTLDLLREMTAKSSTPVAQKDLARKYSGARQALKTLAAKNLVTLREQRVYRDPFGEPPLFFPAPAQLTGEQQTVLEALIPAIEKQEYSPFLLQGVTGSGKTEVYLRATDTALALGRQTIVLVPEIALATQLEGHFLSRFGDRIALLHSGLTPGERYDQWQRIVSGEVKIVIGARSAIFAPFDNIGLIIVDEEHDSAYKQEDGLRYNARDLAVLRASLESAPVILGSATPSLTSFHNSAQGKYRLLSLTKRVEEKPMPSVEIVDLKNLPTVSGRPPLLSNQLRKAIKDNLDAGDQTLLFLNRRGYANLMLCKQCGEPVQCRDCQVTLTLHQGRGQLLCHYCGYTVKSATVCANCQSPEMVAVGFGTERIEDELTRMFPKARLGRLDQDTAANRTNFLKILKQVHNREIDILVGTQMITKGHHFPDVTLVGVVWADAGLGLPDYKAGERTYQLLSQVTGRAGRGDKPGRVIIQTMHPEHYSIIAAREHDYQGLYDREIAFRSELSYPPLSRLVNFRLEGESDEKVRSAATELAARAADYCRRADSLMVLGPAPSPLARLRGRYRWQVLLKGVDMKTLHAVSEKLLQENAPAFSSGAVKLTVDVDPENML